MAVLFHDTNLASAKSILEDKSIRGVEEHGPRSYDAYPHFLHSDYPCTSNNILPVSRDIRLKFDAPFPEIILKDGEFPRPGFICMQFVGETMWQCTLHPQSDPIIFVGYEVFTTDLNRRMKQILDKAMEDQAVIKPHCAFLD